MKRFEFNVTETRAYHVTYIVEAETLEEAERKAAIGDTEQEIENASSLGEVIDRTITEHRRVA